jgi:hypothetical protein
MTQEDTRQSWFSAWPDVLAFVLGLGVAWIAGWTTTDLVWSLWLSSFVVGYSTIVWTIARPGIDIVRGASRDREFTRQVLAEHKGATALGISVFVLGGLVMLAFFTVHFGGFHYVHSQFLYTFFPLDGGEAGRVASAGMSTYLDVAARYWLFLPSAFLAERAGFLRAPALFKDDLSVTAAAIAARKAADASKGAAMVAPYRNVMRMHGLIFFFAFAHLARLDSFLVYAVVYAVYFFPWRLLKGRGDRGNRGRQSDRREVASITSIPSTPSTTSDYQAIP